jgi:hypothetical protein
MRKAGFKPSAMACEASDIRPYINEEYNIKM